MNQEVARLEELLARVRKNAALPRAARGAFVPPAVPQSVPTEAAAVAPPAPAVEFAPPAPAVEFAPPPAEPIVVPAPEFPLPESVPPPAFTDSVDDLLADPFPASSAPPPPPVEEEVPAVAVAATSEHISGVMPVAELTEEAPEELLEDDIVEMSPTAAAEAIAPAAPPSLDDELNFEDEEEAAPGVAPAAEEEPPVSSSRSKVVPATMDEALAHAAEQMEIQEGREVPLKTPPPESGPQAAMVPMPAPAAPDIDELLEADILPVGGVSNAVPTAEQLGQTIDLDEARGPHLELDQPVAAAVAEPAAEELEVTLPGRQFGGGYQADLMPPPEARADLDAHLQRESEEAIPPPPESLAQMPSLQPDARTSGLFAATGAASVGTESPAEAVSTVTIEAPTTTEFAPELLARPDVGATPIAKFVRAPAPRPSTFLELLDSSLALGRD